MSTAVTAAGRYVGQSVKRIEDPRLLSGRGRYVDDVQLVGILHVAFVRSPVARGTITRLDVTAARALEGVHAVYTADDLNPMAQQMWHTLMGPPIEMGGTGVYPPSRPLAHGDVRFVGDPIVLIVAESRYIAEDAADLVELDIDAQPPILGRANTGNDTTNLVHPELGSNIAATMAAFEIPPLEEAFANAAHVVKRSFHQARASNVPMEPRGVIAQYDAFTGELQIWAATQSAHEVKAFASRLTGISENKVRAIANDVGGGFGLKMMVTRDEAALFLAAVKYGDRPLKWIEDRRENLISACQAREEDIDLEMAVDADGHILGMKVHFWEDCGAFPAGSGSTAAMAIGIIPGPYKIPMVGPSSDAVFTNTCGKAAYRGPWMMETVGREQMMDHVAREIGMDPIEFRRRNLVMATDLPYTTCTTMVYDKITPSETMEQALQILDVDAFHREQTEARASGRLLGMGVSVYVEPSAIAFGMLSTDGATIRMDQSGKVVVAVSTGSHGQSVETTLCQVVAEHLGCDIADVTLMQGDTSSSPLGPGTGGSRTAVIAGGAAQMAATRLRDKLIQIAAHTLEAAPEDLEVNRSVVSVRGTPTKAVPFVQLAGMAYQMPEMLPPGMEPGLEANARYAPPAPFTWSNASHVCTVEVDPETGIVKILRYIVSEDCGRMINPMVVEGQIAGGVVQGIGGVLFEHMIYDDMGNPLATTFLDYLLPSAPEIPDIEYGHIETPADNLAGFKGMGEGGAIGAPPAVANAIHDALAHLGVHPTSFPLGPSQIRDLIVEAAAAVR